MTTSCIAYHSIDGCFSPGLLAFYVITPCYHVREMQATKSTHSNTSRRTHAQVQMRAPTERRCPKCKRILTLVTGMITTKLPTTVNSPNDGENLTPQTHTSFLSPPLLLFRCTQLLNRLVYDPPAAPMCTRRCALPIISSWYGTPTRA